MSAHSTYTNSANHTIAALQYITRDDAKYSHAEQAQLLCAAGLRWVQLRVKDIDEGTLMREALATKKVCEAFGATFIVNDNVELALQLKADGVHLGQEDMHPEEARKILGDTFIIGGTANTLEQALVLSRSGVDYIGLGPLRFTPTKKKLSPVLGFEGVEAILRGMRDGRVSVPVIVIGGVTTADVARLKSLGAHGVAVSSALFDVPSANDFEQRVREFCVS